MISLAICLLRLLLVRPLRCLKLGDLKIQMHQPQSLSFPHCFNFCKDFKDFIIGINCNHKAWSELNPDIPNPKSTINSIVSKECIFEYI